MIKNHGFDVNDVVHVTHSFFGHNLTVGKHYTVMGISFMNVKVINDLGEEAWINSWAFSHVPKVTIVKRHLKRIVLGK